MDPTIESEQEPQRVSVAVPWIDRFDHRGDNIPENGAISIDFLTLLQENEFH